MNCRQTRQNPVEHEARKGDEVQAADGLGPPLVVARQASPATSVLTILRAVLIRDHAAKLNFEVH